MRSLWDHMTLSTGHMTHHAVIQFLSSLTLVLSLSLHDEVIVGSHDPPVIQPLSSLTLILSLSAWWGHCGITWLSAVVTWPTSNTVPIITYFSSLFLSAWWGHCLWESCLSVACSCASESPHASFPVERAEGRQRREEKWGEEGRVREREERRRKMTCIPVVT